jgi:hypothetical protein
MYRNVSDMDFHCAAEWSVVFHMFNIQLLIQLLNSSRSFFYLHNLAIADRGGTLVFPHLHFAWYMRCTMRTIFHRLLILRRETLSPL